MFCNQCEQTARSLACTSTGTCGKPAQVSALHDLLTYVLKGLALVVKKADSVAGQSGRSLVPSDTHPFLAKTLFATLTNVNFDPQAIAAWIHEAVERRDCLKTELSALAPEIEFSEAPLTFSPAHDLGTLTLQARAHTLKKEASPDEDIRSLQHTVLYGLRGLAAYAFHAAELGYRDPEIDDYLVETLCDLAHYERGDLGVWVGKALRLGEMNYKTMELLDRAHRDTFGSPRPTEVPLGVKPGKCILVTGHDLLALHRLLEQTEGKGITVYTHGEMLPAHAYPRLKAYSHLYGNYGSAWQEQKREFERFPGAILVTTNCLQEPRDSYLGNIFTTAAVGWPGVTHLADHDFTAVIERALALPGFSEEVPGKTVTVGFMHETVLSQADRIIDLVKQGRIRHFLLVGGCDGAKPGRDYYTRLVEQSPADTVILTLACGKYRFFDRDLGSIDGIPRLLDVGQCNDAYSAVRIALALADAFQVGVNDLPLHLVLSWYEQKAVAILLTLLYLGVKNIRLGPTLPAFLTPAVAQYLVDNYALRPISTPEEDLAAILA